MSKRIHRIYTGDMTQNEFAAHLAERNAEWEVNERVGRARATLFMLGFAAGCVWLCVLSIVQAM